MSCIPAYMVPGTVVHSYLAECINTLCYSAVHAADYFVCFFTQVLPNSFSQLSKLQTLMLSWNHFNSVPPCVGHLKSLETLYICDQHPPKSDGADRWLLASTEVHVPSQLLQLPNLGELGLDFHDRQPVRPPVLQELYLQGVSIQNETDMGNRESAWESQLQQLQDDGLNW